MRIRLSPERATDANARAACGGGEVDAAFGSLALQRRRAGRTTGRGGRGQPRLRQPEAVADCAPARRCSTSARAAGSTCCCRPGASGDRIRLRRGHDRRDARPRPGQRSQGRGRRTSSSSRAPSRTIPLPDAAVDVVISNCVINLSTDKPAVLAEMFRVLTPGGRIGVSDVVAEDRLSPAERAERGSYVGCIAGALSRQEYLDGLAAAGFRRRGHLHPRGRTRHARRDRAGDETSRLLRHQCAGLLLRAVSEGDLLQRGSPGRFLRLRVGPPARARREPDLTQSAS